MGGVLGVRNPISLSKIENFFASRCEVFLTSLLAFLGMILLGAGESSLAVEVELRFSLALF